MTDNIRTKQLLDIMFPPAHSETQELLDELTEGFDSILRFTYANRQGGKPREWNVDLQQSVFFTFRDKKYMIIRGSWSPVCFDMDRMQMEANLEVDCLGLEYLEADMFPTEDTQDWLLTQKGF